MTTHRRTPRPPHRRATLNVTTEQLAALLRLPNDVDVVAFMLDPIRDSVVFGLQSDRFDPVPAGAEPPALQAEQAVVVVDDDGAVTLRVAWPGLEGAGVTIRREPATTADLDDPE